MSLCCDKSTNKAKTTDSTKTANGNPQSIQFEFIYLFRIIRQKVSSQNVCSERHCAATHNAEMNPNMEQNSPFILQFESGKAWNPHMCLKDRCEETGFQQRTVCTDKTQSRFILNLSRLNRRRIFKHSSPPSGSKSCALTAFCLHFFSKKKEDQNVSTLH